VKLEEDRIYLDHAATTPVRPEVFEAMAPYFHEFFGNAGSLHRFGRDAKKAIDTARSQVAALIGADPRDIVFTSGGTEANNLAIRGLAAENSRVMVSAVEHHSVLHAAKKLEKRNGIDVVLAPVDSEGRVESSAELPSVVDAEHGVQLRATTEHRKRPTSLVSVMHGNNETGTIQPVEEIGSNCRDRGIPFHIDAVQSAGKASINVSEMPVDLLSISAHKLYGPKGIGALYVRRDLPLQHQIAGGSQERGRRAGTENVAAIVGFGMACELAQKEMEIESARLRDLLCILEDRLLESCPGTWVNGSREHRLPHILNIGFPGVEGEEVMMALDAKGIAVATGSACTSGAIDPSHVLLAMGQNHTQAHSGVRFSLGRSTTLEAIEEVAAALHRVR
jgi:cysteine desulfurase